MAGQIEETILSGRFPPGEKLPPEREMIHQFEVSRRTLREALRVLEQKGLLEIKTGAKGGAFVKKITSRQMREGLAILIRSGGVSLKELSEFRHDIEGIVAHRAAQRATKEDLDELNGLISQGKAVLQQRVFDWKGFLDIDRKVHLALARIARNIMHESIMKTIHDNIQRYYENYLPKTKGVSQQNYQELADIVKAVETGDPQSAQRLAEDHVARGNHYMEMAMKKDKSPAG